MPISTALSTPPSSRSTAFNGERCTANSRALIEESIFDDFTRRLAARAARVKVGSPLDPDTEVGPLIHPEHRDRVLGYIDIGKKEGAELLVGGERVGSEGNYVSPALFTGENHMRIAQEEIFGPVLTAIPFQKRSRRFGQSQRREIRACILCLDRRRGPRPSHGVGARSRHDLDQQPQRAPSSDALRWRQVQRDASRRRRALLRVLHRAKTYRRAARSARHSRIWKKVTGKG
jgi:hypothetical protein